MRIEGISTPALKIVFKIQIFLIIIKKAIVTSFICAARGGNDVELKLK